MTSGLSSPASIFGSIISSADMLSPRLKDSACSICPSPRSDAACTTVSSTEHHHHHHRVEQRMWIAGGSRVELQVDPYLLLPPAEPPSGPSMLFPRLPPSLERSSTRPFSQLLCSQPSSSSFTACPARPGIAYSRSDHTRAPPFSTSTRVNTKVWVAVLLALAGSGVLY